MILERLEITGFGSLHELTTDMHPRVTVITGRNEAGKSTLLRAVRGALYGIDAGGQFARSIAATGRATSHGRGGIRPRLDVQARRRTSHPGGPAPGYA